MRHDSPMTRQETIEALSHKRFDVLVVGGGIIGAAVAAHTARHGLAVALVERGDFGGATSSSSSKLIHGGLRYLRLGDVRLVRESHHERRTLSTVVAPHLVRRIPFLLPLYRGGPYRPAVVQSAILFYSALARSRLNWLVQPGRARRLVPALREEELRACALYADAWTNDARLCLANVRAAADAGACVLNGAEVVELRRTAGRVAGAEVAVDGETVGVDARVVVNAAGPWIDEMRRLEDPAAGTSVVLAKGVHALVPADGEWSAALTIPQDRLRVTFALPLYGMLLLGTTDEPLDVGPGEVTVEPGDVEQVVAEAAVAVDPSLATLDRVRAAYAGARVLPAGEGQSASLRRETVISRGSGAMLSVAGGKLTTYRRIAIDVLERLRSDLDLPRVDARPWPLPGAGDLTSVRLPTELEPSVREHLLHLYGTLAAEVVSPAVEEPELLELLHEGGPDIAAQARYAASHEWARSADDVIRRRTTLFYRGLGDDPLVVSRVEDFLGRGVRPALG
jgi:glycerol-3-phosphate dehydrogenase